MGLSILDLQNFIEEGCIVEEFKLDHDCITNVILGDEFEKDCEKLRSGYILAAKTMIKASLDNPLTDGYHLVYPILYSLRHYMELELKYYYTQFKGKWPKGKGHKLNEEWYEEIRINYERLIGLSVPSQIIDYIDLFNNIDPKGDYFKYEFDTKQTNFRKDTFDEKGQRIKWGDPFHVGLKSLSSDIEIIEGVFLELADAL